MYYTYLSTTIGSLLIAGDGEGLCEIQFPEGHTPASPRPGWVENADVLSTACEQLTEYFAGRRRAFDLELSPRGTEFQRSVWRELARIPYGETRSYGEVAARIGRPRASRAVGAANGRNPLPIVLPCHRVIGADGSLTGFGGGLHRKEALLALERSEA